MNLKLGDRNMLMLLGAFLLVGTCVLGVRSVGTIDEVLAVRAPAVTASRPDLGKFDGVAGAMAERADRLAAAAAGQRDPFTVPVVEKAAVPEKAAPVVRRPPPLPRLQALVYDNVAPAVRLTVGTAASDWLKAGESFKGWTVVEINPGSARVRNDTRTLHLGMN